VRHDNHKLRVAYMVRTFNTGGLERCIARLANHLDRERFQPMVICLRKNGTAADWIERDDVPILELNQRDGNDPLAIRRLARMLKEQRVDVVHSHNWGTLVETALARRWAAVPVHVHAERGLQFELRQRAGWKESLRRRVSDRAFRSVARVTVPADAIREFLEDRHPGLRGKIDVISNGVDSPDPNQLEQLGARVRQEAGIPTSAQVIGSIGRIVPVKGFEDLIRAVSRLRSAHPGVHLVLVGDGPERGRLEELAEELELSQSVHFLGHRNDVAACLGAMDIYVNSSHSEGMSQSILEAMAAGLPLVVTDVGDNAELVGGSDACGLVVPSHSPDELARALSLLIAPGHRRNMYQEQSLRRHEQRYSINTMTSRYEDLYTNLALPTVRTDQEVGII